MQQGESMQVSFSPKLKTYYFLIGAITLTVTVLGIVLLPVWAIWGTWWARKYYNSLRLEISDRAVVIGKGVFFRQEVTLPLDKIQDITIFEGPVLDRLGLLGLRMETAGQRNAATGKSEGDLLGVMDARSVRDHIIAQRDRLAAKTHAVQQPVASSDILVEIRDSLHRIEARLSK